jgi:hypothetical protein
MAVYPDDGRQQRYGRAIQSRKGTARLGKILEERSENRVRRREACAGTRVF